MHCSLFLRGVSTFCGRLDVTGVVRRCVAGSSERRHWRIALLLLLPPLPLAQRSAVLHCKRAHLPDTARSAFQSICGDTCTFFFIEINSPRFKMIKNGHHHQHQGSTAAGTDAGMTPGAAAYSPEKRRRRVRVWCDGWWVPYDWPWYENAVPLWLIVIEHAWMNVTYSTNWTGLLRVAELAQDSSALILRGYALNF